MAANEKTLGNLHEAVAQALIVGVQPRELPGYVDEETGEEVPAQVLPPSPAMLQAAAKFLKDNNVTCDVSDDNSMGELADLMAKRRAALAPPSKADIASDVSFLDSRLN